MMSDGAETVRPFPPIKDFDASKVFAKDIGFAVLLDGDVAICGVADPAGVLWRIALSRVDRRFDRRRMAILG